MNKKYPLQTPNVYWNRTHSENMTVINKHTAIIDAIMIVFVARPLSW